MSPRFNMWVPSPPRPVIGPAAYYPFSDGGVMKAPLPPLIVAGLFGIFGLLNIFLGFYIFVNIRTSAKRLEGLYLFNQKQSDHHCCCRCPERPVKNHRGRSQNPRRPPPVCQLPFGTS